MGAILWAIAMLAAQPQGPPAGDDQAKRRVTASSGADSLQGAIVELVAIAGNRRVRSDAIRAQIESRTGARLDRDQIERDVRKLARSGWFDDVGARLKPLRERETNGDTPVMLEFDVRERPWLTAITFGGAREIDEQRAKDVLAKKKIELKIGAPLDRFAVWRATLALKEDFQAHGYTDADVRAVIERSTAESSAILRFEVAPGEKTSVGRVKFTGNRAFSEKKLRGEMQIDPSSQFAALRGKTFYSEATLRLDLERLGQFYRDHGYPEATMAEPLVETRLVRKRGMFSFRSKAASQIEITIPIDEGARFVFAAPHIRDEGSDAAVTENLSRYAGTRVVAGAPYSESALMKVRGVLAAGTAAPREKDKVPREVHLDVDLSREAALASPEYVISPRKAYILRTLEFTGQRKFTDRYYRRHIPLIEGETFDPRKLQAGLARLARTGYIKPVKPEDVRAKYDERRGTVDVTIHVSEIGQQKFSLIGGQSNLGSTAGIAYSVFNLLGGEELIDSQLEGGPDLLRVALTLSEESVFGTRASLAMSVFNYFVRPNLTSLAGDAHFLKTHTSGFGAGWGYPVAENQSLIVNYTDAHAASRYSLDLPPSLTGVASGEIGSQTNSVSHSIGATWDAREGAQHWQTGASVAGGALGGTANLLRANVEYDVHAPDPFSRGRNSWAIRGYGGAVGSFAGDLLYPERAFAGPELLRGFRSGEIAPYAQITSTDALGNSSAQAVSTGANLIDAMNIEYRVPLTARFSVAGFLDSGNGWLLPNWLGPDRPALLAGTNGLLRASAGFEVQWRAPIIEQTVNVSLSANIRRLAKTFLLSDGTFFRAPDRRFALGWALGPRF